MLVDSHCHLNFPDFKDDLDAVVKRAQEGGVGVMQTICTELAEFDEIHAIANRFDGVFCSVGVHPNDSAKAEIPEVKELVDRAKFTKVIGIGETGLDYHYKTSPKELQIESFRRHIKAAQETGLPIIVHSRDADEDTVRIMQEEKEKGDFKAVIHCFTSTKYLADESVRMGFYISLSGIITFKNAQAIRDAIVDVPLDRFLVETDAPYLAPAPNRGKRNEPLFTKYTNKLLSEIKVKSEEEMATITTANFYRLFSKAAIA
jgi:TatD DNase family protein